MGMEKTTEKAPGKPVRLATNVYYGLVCSCVRVHGRTFGVVRATHHTNVESDRAMLLSLRSAEQNGRCGERCKRAQ